MAEFLKIRLADATEEEQARFEAFNGSIVLMAAESVNGTEPHNIIKEYNGKEEILQLLAAPFPPDCFLGIREIAYESDKSTMYVYVNRVYLLQPPGATLPQPQSIRPNKAIINNSKVAKQLTTIEDNTVKGIDFDIVVDSKRKVAVTAFLRYDAAQVSGRPLTAYDKVVHNSICSLYEAGNEFFNLQMVYRAMNGLTDSERIIEERGTLEPIRESIEASRLKLFTVDATEQARAWNSDIKKATYEGYFLPLEKVTVLFKNSTEPEECYHFMKAPPLFEYSKNISQIITHNIKLLDSRKAVKNSPEVAIIRDYLIQRISDMKCNQNGVNNHKIKYATLYTDCGIEESSLTQTEKNRKREKIKKLLEHFKHNNFIKGFDEYKKGRSFEGVTIQL